MSNDDNILNNKFEAANANMPSIRISPKSTALFAASATGKKLIAQMDDYIQNLSPYDAKAKMQENREITAAEFMAFQERQVIDWTEAEKNKTVRAIRFFKEHSKNLSLPLPEQVFFVMTTGKEEGGGAFTRGNTIFLPKAFMQAPDDWFNKVICHEFFHVISRANPGLREALYALIGFESCTRPILPDELENRRITNPDAPCNNHTIKVQHNGQNHMAIPIIYAPDAHYDTEKKLSFFEFMQFSLLLVRKNSEGQTQPLFKNGKVQLVSPSAASGFFEKIGRNTEYIIHPEEVLAENFVHMLLKTPGLANPEIPIKMEKIIEAYGAQPALHPRKQM
ncbi:MAG: hypothetical protein H6867_03800 [Rhodospirillales bacterium]|nr:hypothetical protein [Rhodospirillales bacterium]MCB9996274.1 hypothetical protein [Rhodospirillales bacterium]